ncbi:hypothetical protein PPL_12014 [Heterostelium album PN500]|uniref:G8 domain-containing protein n=1 Tax=Heterostelium pallidum (strain ATCC 26659 / Pp 5 / PN500) TaxID=670386 RepID=D3BV42_HETP5|nr:hypothetical protein PPL_12014 [Heterostelium album PN500]EFA74980.1 hypothetical protein PPL_12014 [Heterostelium album PN500]|eukprot:XP_020427114.1 hypothetical protein PPL_12014 [Heterostelium album PN500]
MYSSSLSSLSYKKIFININIIFILYISVVFGYICNEDVPRLTRWSNAASWPNKLVPKANDAVIIQTKIMLDLESPPLAYVLVNGSGMLIFEDKPGVSLTTQALIIVDGGSVCIGSPLCPYTNKTTITLTGYSEYTANNFTVDGFPYGQKVIAVGKDGTLEIHGQEPLPAWAKLDRNGRPGDTLLTLNSKVSWKSGSEVMIASSDYDYGQTEFNTIVDCPSCAPNQIKLANPLVYLHWGTFIEGMDQRASISMITRNIVVRGRVEENHCVSNPLVCRFFPNYTFGAHIMITRGFKNAHFNSLRLEFMGQPHMISRYPIHFHMVGDVSTYFFRPYVKNTVILNSHNRCIVLHGVYGLLVQDNVAYDHIGHCYMLCDGIEMNNVIDRNIGILTRSGLVTPADRNDEMCKAYKPLDFNGNPTQVTECNAVSTFWISNPNNVLTNNIAGGSENTGIWYVVPEYPGGESFSTGVDQHIQPVYTLIKKFQNNTVHSNRVLGFNLDSGLKLYPPSKEEPQQINSLISIRYNPRVDFTNRGSPMRPALLEGLVCYKNMWRGAWARGNIIMDNCYFADNAISLTLASEGTYPSDKGIAQLVTNSLFIGESENNGSYSWDRAPVHRNRTNPFGENWKMPIRGFEVYDGPVMVTNCSFRHFKRYDDRNISAISWYRLHDYTFSSLSYMENNEFIDVDHKLYMNNLYQDGDKCQNIFDKDKLLHYVRNIPIYKTDKCIEEPERNLLVCNESMAYIYFYVPYPERVEYNNNGPQLVVARDTHLNLTLSGLPNHNPKNHFLVLVHKNYEYTFHFDKHPVPQVFDLEAINWDQNDTMDIGICIGVNSIRSLQVEKVIGYKTLPKLFPVSDRLKLDNNSYFYDTSNGMLFVKLNQIQKRPDLYAFPEDGSERIRITLEQSPVFAVADCRTNYYTNSLMIFNESIHYLFKNSILNNISPIPIATNESIAHFGKRYIATTIPFQMKLHSSSPFPLKEFSYLEFWVMTSTTNSAIDFVIGLITENNLDVPIPIADYKFNNFNAQVWNPIRISLSTLNLNTFTDITIYGYSSSSQTIFIDDIGLIYYPYTMM